MDGQTTYNDIRQGFVYERVPHITLKSIANNAEIDVIWENFSGEALRTVCGQLLNAELNMHLGGVGNPSRQPAMIGLPRQKQLHADWWELAYSHDRKRSTQPLPPKLNYEYLYDKPYEDKNIVRVAGPFTVESLSPHRELGVDENDELIGSVGDVQGALWSVQADFAEVVLENLSTAGVQQAHKEDKINFTSIETLAW